MVRRWYYIEPIDDKVVDDKETIYGVPTLYPEISIKHITERLKHHANPKRNFEPYQVRGVVLMAQRLHKSTTILCEKPGSGKTTTLCAFVLSALLMHPSRNVIFMIVPKSLIEDDQWKKEIHRNTRSETDTVYTIRKTKEILKIFDDLGKEDGKLGTRRWILMSNGLIQCIKTYNLKEKVKEFISNYVAVLGIDEYHTVGLLTGKIRGEIMRSLLAVVNGFKVLISGTPLRNDTEEITKTISNVFKLAKEEFATSEDYLKETCELAKRISIRQIACNSILKEPLDLDVVLVPAPRGYDKYRHTSGRMFGKPVQDMLRAAVDPIINEWTTCDKDSVGVHLSPKMKYVLQLLDEVPEEDNVLITAFHNDVIDYVTQVLQKHNIRYQRIRSKKCQIREYNRVALLTSTAKEGIDGLQYRYNWIVFIQPPQMTSHLEQMITRLKRRGQSKRVHARWVIAQETFDVERWNILQGHFENIRAFMTHIETLCDENQG